MDTQAFAKHLKSCGKKEHVIKGLIDEVGRFESFLTQEKHKSLTDAAAQDIQDYADRFETHTVKEPMRSLALYYAFVGNETLARQAGEIREGGIAKDRKVFKLRDFRGVNPEDIARLTARGIVTVEQMLDAGKTPQSRQHLAEQTGIAPTAILELVKLSDLTRLGAVKSIRARLYYDAGLDTPEKFTQWEPDALRQTLIAFVERTQFEGIAPLPKEIRNTIAAAQTLPSVVEYE